MREIGEIMGVAVATVDAWLNDPGGRRLQARRDSYRGECDTCGAPTDGSNGSAKAPARCADCIRWSSGAIVEAIQGWADDHGGIPPRAIDCRHDGHGSLPNESTVKRVFGSWNAGLLAAGFALHQDKRPETTQAMADAIRGGMRTEDVGVMFGVSESAVRMRLNYHGMKLRDLRRAA
jgi:hypothetical protein